MGVDLQIFIDFAKQQRDGMPVATEVKNSRSATSLRQSALTYTPTARMESIPPHSYNADRNSPAGYRGLAYHNPLIEISDETAGFKTSKIFAIQLFQNLLPNLNSDPLAMSEESQERDSQTVSIDFRY